jgi:tRNA(Ile2)-agmatinylcytidine synthase
MSKSLVQIGMDDIDSPDGRCTTHFASLVVENLKEWNVDWVDYPNLIRLNPNIPYRTRGNGAVALRFMTNKHGLDSIIPMVESLIQSYVEKNYPNTNPGVVFLESKASEKIQNLAELAQWRVVPIQLASRVIKANDIAHITKGNGRGLIGALSAVANTLQGDHTYEYIAYRLLEDCNGKRGVDPDSVRGMDKKMGNSVFSNIDSTTNRIMIEPHGKDPVLYGIRGETPDSVIEAAKLVRSKQNVDRWMVFRSNQGTGEHLKHQVKIKYLRPYMTAVVAGRVETKPVMIEGGHAIFSIQDDETNIDCAAYEPTGEFRETIMKLAIGDSINVHAGVRPASRRHGLTLNLEGLEVMGLREVVEVSNPVCPKCGKRMKSAGAEQGYKCVKCGHRDKEISKIEKPLVRNLQRGLYLPPQRAQRHLTRPYARDGKMNSGIPSELVPKWHSH